MTSDHAFDDLGDGPLHLAKLILIQGSPCQMRNCYEQKKFHEMLLSSSSMILP